MWVDNWIIWIPNGSIWTPDNIRKVHAQGVEATVKGENRINSFKVFWKFGYSYTKSTNKTTNDDYDRSFNKQLPFVPFHNAIALAGMSIHSFDININGNYTGRRFTTTDNESFLDEYWLIDMDVSQNLHLTGSTLKIGFTIKNLLNTSYFNLPFRAMPGINYCMYISMKL
jgi:iron complex outermembrane receptor protein